MKNKQITFSQICGLDEAGRGSLAGPLVAAAIKINSNIEFQNPKLKDGKLLSPIQRQKIYEQIKNYAEIFIEVISVEEINEKGIGWANRQIFINLISKISAEKYIIDGNLKIPGAQSIIDADATIPEVILAGIVAKVERDKIMCELHKNFEGYDWQTNKGYGTKRHIEAIKFLGPCCHHRTVFVSTALSPKLKEKS